MNLASLVNRLGRQGSTKNFCNFAIKYPTFKDFFSYFHGQKNTKL